MLVSNRNKSDIEYKELRHQQYLYDIENKTVMSGG